VHAHQRHARVEVVRTRRTDSAASCMRFKSTDRHAITFAHMTTANTLYVFARGILEISLVLLEQQISPIAGLLAVLFCFDLHSGLVHAINLYESMSRLKYNNDAI